MNLLRRGIMNALGTFDLAENFATTLYLGNTTAQSIVSNLDYTTKDGLVWIKDRDAVNRHYQIDTVRGNDKNLQSDSTAAEATAVNTITTFNNNGFDLGAANDINGARNFVAWQFMKAAGFFDIVEWVATGVGGQVVPHNLGHESGLLIYKSLHDATDWYVQHKDVAATEYLQLNTTAAEATSAGAFNNTAMTSSDFTVGGFPNAGNFIAYLFAHNPDKGIYCGSYTGTGAAGNKVVTGFPVGWVAVKRIDGVESWYVYDAGRGSNNSLRPDDSGAEQAGTVFTLDSDGFTVGGTVPNASGGNYIFMAIADPTQF